MASRQLAVGQPLEPGVTRYEELPEYNYRNGEHRLLLFMENITLDELAAVREGDAKFAFTVIGDVLIFQYRFGSALPWSDAAYTWHRVPEEEQIRPPALEGPQRAALLIILVEATTGIVQALRMVSLSPTMSRRLHEAINRQAAAPLPADYDDQIRRIFERFTSKELRDLALASCTGGDVADRASPY